MKIAVLVFPGSNCDQDMYFALRNVLHYEAEYVFHTETSLDGFDAVCVPGGFSYGDYLRCGAIARFSPIMPAVIQFAESGKTVLGVCNGFQILLEAGLLEGALLRNEQLQFVCKNTPVIVENNQTRFTQLYAAAEVLHLPIAHGEGNYFCDDATYRRLQQRRQIVLRYHNENPNGSLHCIAGICNERGNVLGMMPHPERAVESLLNNTDGLRLLQAAFSEAVVPV